MSDTANISSLDAICRFAAAVVQFQTEARLCLTAMDSQLRQTQFWLERDRPSFWKREIEACTRAIADARVRLHQCRMRRVGDFRPTCFEEQKDLEQAERNLNYSQKQIPTVKRWQIAALHEANEFHGRSSQMIQALERELPRLLALLKFAIDRIETYAAVQTPTGSAAASRLNELAEELQRLLSTQADTEAPPPADQIPPTDSGNALPATSEESSDEPTPPRAADP